MKLGTISALALGASGVAIALMPEATADNLKLSALTPRGTAEIRAGLGGTFVGLGLWAAARGSKDAHTAVGMTWLGAAALRSYAVKKDQPETDVTYWTYLAGEITLGLAGLISRGSTSSSQASR